MKLVDKIIRFSNKYHYILLLFIVVVFILNVYVIVNQYGLCYDGLQSVCYSSQPLFESTETELFSHTLNLPKLFCVIKDYDQHPILYYFQLHFWMLLCDSDSWIKINSCVVGLLALIILFNIVRKYFNLKVAFVSTFLLSMSPLFIKYSASARMYIFMLLFYLLTYSNLKMSLKYRAKLKYKIFLLLSLIVFVNLHAIGVIILFPIWSYILLDFLDRSIEKDKFTIRKLINAIINNERELLSYIGISVISVLSVLFWLTWNMKTSVSHTKLPNINIISQDFIILLTGGYLRNYFSTKAVIASVFGALFIVSICRKKTRNTALSFVIVPIIVNILVSYTIKPVWLVRTIFFTLPFIILSSVDTMLFLAEQIGKIRKYAQYILLAVLLLSTTYFYTQYLSLQKSKTLPFILNEYSKLSTWAESNLKEGDSVYFPRYKEYWSFMWYFKLDREIDIFSCNSHRTYKNIDFHIHLESPEYIPENPDYIISRIDRKIPHKDNYNQVFKYGNMMALEKIADVD